MPPETEVADEPGLGWVLDPTPTQAPVLVVVAHPDDETLGLGGRLRRMGAATTLLHVTDGAPRDRRWWGAPELTDRAAYARARREELVQAMAVAGIGRERLGMLGIVDQEASLDLAALTLRLYNHLRALRPRIIVTHAYEGGHPDHDATAFAVHWARRLLERAGSAALRGRSPAVVEFPAYHAGPNGGMRTGRFLPAPQSCRGWLGEAAAPASDTECKQRMLACFATQQEMLRQFGLEERFRTAPDYHFGEPPHSGPLFYERFAWGVDGHQWRRLAAAAEERLRRSVV